ncbi:MAG: DbpA RNA binding domain-containing protein [Gemmatimonadaceae bacterium]|nr:DbpA RNA binding domain-containing protein [Gemmatimonadaceae bacterium]
MVDEAELNDELPAVGRNQNVVYSLPLAMDSIPAFLQGPLERIDPAAGGTQLVIITPDGESALAISEAVLSMTGLGGIEVLAVTTAGRARRLLAMRPIAAIAGPALELKSLIESASLKLDQVGTVALAWVDETLKQGGEQVAAMEAVMSEIPKEAVRVLVARTTTPEVEQVVERYMRRARREATADSPIAATDLELRYVTVSSASRPSALRRLLDELDPPSAVVVARSAASELEARTTLRRLGYNQESDPVRLTTGDVPANTHTVILYDPPVSAGEVARAATATPVQAFTLVQPRELEFLRSLSGLDLIPYAAGDSVAKARVSDAVVRDELKGILDEGIISREIIALEPLLEEYDAIEIAAASLRLLERARAARDASEKVARAAGVKSSGPTATAESSEGMTTIFMTIGTLDGVRAGDIVGAIAGEVGIPGSSIGRVEIKDKHSLVEIESGKAQDVIKKMNGLQIRGRKLAVREERERPPRSAGAGAPRGDRPPRRDGPPRGERPDRDRGARSDRPPRGDRPPRSGPPRDRSGPPRDRGDRPGFSDRGRRPRG